MRLSIVELAILSSVCFGQTALAKSEAPQKLNREKIFGEVVGTEDRQSMTSTEHPWSTIGKVTFKKPNGKPGWCTGTLVGDDLVLTNAHCVHQRDGKFFSNVIFRPNYMHGFAKYGSVANRVWSGIAESDEDWAILRLNSPLGDHFGYLGVRAPSIEDLKGDDWQERLVLAGYSEDWERGETAGVHLGCSVSGIESGSFKHDCDMSGGSSGSGIFGYFSSGIAIVGLNWAGSAGRGHNLGVLGKHYKKLVSKLQGNDDGKPSETYFYACNEGSDRAMSIAYAFYTDNWTTHGWWDVAPGRCREIPTPEEDDGTIYVHARDGRRSWGTGATFCISNDAFKIENADQGCRTGLTAGFSKMAIERGKFRKFSFTR